MKCTAVAASANIQHRHIATIRKDTFRRSRTKTSAAQTARESGLSEPQDYLMVTYRPTLSHAVGAERPTKLRLSQRGT